MLGKYTILGWGLLKKDWTTYPTPVHNRLLEPNSLIRLKPSGKLINCFVLQQTTKRLQKKTGLCNF